MFKFNLGQTVKDKYTDFHGVITARSENLTSVNRYGVQGPYLKDGKVAEYDWFDEDRIELSEFKPKSVIGVVSKEG